MDKDARDQGRRLEQISSREFSGKYQGADTFTSIRTITNSPKRTSNSWHMLQEKITWGNFRKCARLRRWMCNRCFGFSPKTMFHMSFLGIDVSEELVAIAKNKVPNASFLVSGVQDLSTKFSEKFDVVLCFGVPGIFDEIEAEDAVLNMLDVTKKKFVYIFSQFNEYDVDVKIRHRRVNSCYEWQGMGCRLE